MGVSRSWKLVITHAIVVGGLLLVVLLSAWTADDQDRNVVGAAATLALFGLGLPWTVPLSAAHHLHHTPDPLVTLAMCGPAVLNVAIGALLAYGTGAIRRRTTHRV